MTFIQASSYKAVTKNAISVFHEIPLDVTVVLCYFKKCQVFGMERQKYYNVKMEGIKCICIYNTI